MRRVLLLVGVLLVFAVSCWGDNAIAGEVDLTCKAFALPEDNRFEPAKVLVVVTAAMDDGFYIYANDPGSTGQPTDVVATLVDGESPVTYYLPGKEKPDPVMAGEYYNAYEKEVRFYIPLEESPTSSISMNVSFSALICTDSSCLPFNSEFTFTHTGDGAAIPMATEQQWWQETEIAEPGTAVILNALQSYEDDYDESLVQDHLSLLEFSPRYHAQSLEVKGLLKAIVLAVLAGLILNVMPCVLPVISLKMRGLMVQGEGAQDVTGKTFRAFNLFFALGIMTFFFLLSLVFSTIGLAWGELFQNDIFVLATAVIVFALSLSLFGVFNLPIIDLKGDNSHSRSGAFSAGILATLLATPCSGPLLGGVLAWALLRSPVIIAVVFLSIGLGMSLPYLLMALRSKPFSVFTSSAAWTRHMEHIAGFLLVATCVYLLSILPDFRIIPALILLLSTAVGAWIWGNLTSLSDADARRVLVRTVAVSLVVATAYLVIHPPEPEAHWEEFDSQMFVESLGVRPMVLDFTADWCPNCKVLEATVLGDDNLAGWKELYDLDFIKVDLTDENPVAMGLLEQLGSKSIPVLAIFPAGPDALSPIVIRDLFTKADMDEGLKRALR